MKHGYCGNALHKNLGAWVRTFRQTHGIGQKAFADMCRVNQRTIYLLESGKRTDRYIYIYKQLADVMGVSLDTMFKPIGSERLKPHVTSIDVVSARSHKIAVSKEWWVDYHEAPARWKPFVLATKIALIASEVNEALEEARKNAYQKYEKDGKPEGVVVELADAIIRIFDFCEHLGLDLKGALLDKLSFNETRPVKHGKVF